MANPDKTLELVEKLIAGLADLNSTMRQHERSLKFLKVYAATLLFPSLPIADALEALRQQEAEYVSKPEDDLDGQTFLAMLAALKNQTSGKA